MFFSSQIAPRQRSASSDAVRGRLELLSATWRRDNEERFHTFYDWGGLGNSYEVTKIFHNISQCFICLVVFYLCFFVCLLFRCSAFLFLCFSASLLSTLTRTTTPTPPETTQTWNQPWNQPQKNPNFNFQFPNAANRYTRMQVAWKRIKQILQTKYSYCMRYIADIIALLQYCNHFLVYIYILMEGQAIYFWIFVA